MTEKIDGAKIPLGQGRSRFSWALFLILLVVSGSKEDNMCGFCGFTGQVESKATCLTNMMNKIIHRGPDSVRPICYLKPNQFEMSCGTMLHW